MVLPTEEDLCRCSLTIEGAVAVQVEQLEVVVQDVDVLGSQQTVALVEVQVLQHTGRHSHLAGSAQSDAARTTVLPLV